MNKNLKSYNTEQLKGIEIRIAKTLNLDVKNIKYFSGHDGMQGVNADLYFDNKKFATAYDDARGGCMDIRPISYENIHLQTFKDVESAIGKYPEYIYVFDGGHSMTLNHDLEALINAIISNKEFLKDSKKGILYRKMGSQYIVSWGSSIPVFLKKSDKALQIIQKKYDELALKYKIENVDYLESIGIKTTQLV